MTSDNPSSLLALLAQVAIGSYPDVTGKYSEYQVLLRFEGRDGDAVAAATSAAREQLPTFDIL